MSDQARVLTVTLNPALDVWAEIKVLEPEVKLRCRNARYEPGGGGVNVARAIRELKGEVTAFIVTGGTTGHWVADMLAASGIEVIAEDVEGCTRPSFHVLETSTGDLYRFVLSGMEFTSHDAAKVEEALLAAIETVKPAYVVVSGSLPPGASESLLPHLASRCKATGTHFIADTSGSALDALIGAGAFLIKLSAAELDEIAATLGLQQGSMVERAHALIENGTAEIVVVTLAEDGGLLVCRNARLHLPALPITKVSSVGAGDSFVAGLVLMLARGESIETAFRHGMAAGAAAIATPGSELLHKADFDRLLPLALSASAERSN